MITPENWLAIQCAIPGYAVSTFAETWLSLRRAAMSTDLPYATDRRSRREVVQAPAAGKSPSSTPAYPPFARVG